MKHTKRWLALLLALVLTFGIGASAMAEEIEHEEIVFEVETAIKSQMEIAEVPTEAGKVLVAAVDKITVKAGEKINLTKLLQGTAWGMSDLEVHQRTENGYDGHQEIIKAKGDPNAEKLPIFANGHNGEKSTIIVKAPDGAEVSIAVTVKYSFLNWFQFLFAMGWWNNYGMPQNTGETIAGSAMTLLILPILPIILLVVFISR